MSNIYAKKSTSQYVVVDFDNVTENGLKTLISALGKAGAAVESVEANNRKTKKDGVYVKRVKLNFENKQNIVLFITEYGDIFQMTLNGKKHPVPNVNTELALSKELAKTLAATQAAFDKSALKKLNRKPRATSTEKPLSQSLSQKIQTSQANLSTANADKQKAADALNQANEALNSQNAEVSRLKALLDAEYAETQDLETQLDNAKKAL